MVWWRAIRRRCKGEGKRGTSCNAVLRPPRKSYNGGGKKEVLEGRDGLTGKKGGKGESHDSPSECISVKVLHRPNQG